MLCFFFEFKENADSLTSFMTSGFESSKRAIAGMIHVMHEEQIC